MQKNNRKTTEKQPNIYLDEDEDKEFNKETTIVAKKDGLSLTIEQRKEEFKNSIEPFKEEYNAEMLNDFFEYWTEPNRSNTKMRFERETSWDIRRRLSRWEKHNRRTNG